MGERKPLALHSLLQKLSNRKPATSKTLCLWRGNTQGEARYGFFVSRPFVCDRLGNDYVGDKTSERHEPAATKKLTFYRLPIFRHTAESLEFGK